MAAAAAKAKQAALGLGDTWGPVGYRASNCKNLFYFMLYLTYTTAEGNIDT